MDIETVENKVIQDISITGLTQSNAESIAKNLTNYFNEVWNKAK